MTQEMSKVYSVVTGLSEFIVTINLKSVGVTVFILIKAFHFY